MAPAIQSCPITADRPSGDSITAKDQNTPDTGVQGYKAAKKKDKHFGIPMDNLKNRRPYMNDMRRKTRICWHFSSGRSCPFGDECAYAHGNTELRPRHLWGPDRVRAAGDVRASGGKSARHQRYQSQQALNRGLAQEQKLSQQQAQADGAQPRSASTKRGSDPAAAAAKCAPHAVSGDRAPQRTPAPSPGLTASVTVGSPASGPSASSPRDGPPQQATTANVVAPQTTQQAAGISSNTALPVVPVAGGSVAAGVQYAAPVVQVCYLGATGTLVPCAPQPVPMARPVVQLPPPPAPPTLPSPQVAAFPTTFQTPGVGPAAHIKMATPAPVQFQGPRIAATATGNGRATTSGSSPPPRPVAVTNGDDDYEQMPALSAEPGLDDPSSGRGLSGCQPPCGFTSM